jgi:hypothetical protein
LLPASSKTKNNIFADPDAKNSVSMRQFVILVGVPASTSKEAVIRSLPSNLRVVGVWIYLDQGLAVLQLPHAVSQDTLRTVTWKHFLNVICSNMLSFFIGVPKHHGWQQRCIPVPVISCFRNEFNHPFR